MARQYKRRANSNYQFTAARQEALRKARAASAAKRSSRAREAKRTVYATEHAARQTSKKFTPYARINRHSQSVGLAARHKIPGTDRRFVAGVNVRVEKISRTTVADKFTPHTTMRHGRVKSSFAQHTLFNQGLTRAARSGIKTGRRGGRSSAV
jgi:hypothetical protein